MRFLLVTAGSRGDVEPFALLARRLSASGHSVRLIVPDGSAVDLEGIEAGSLGVDFNALIQAQGVSPVAAMRAMGERIRPAMATVFATAAREVVATRPDVVVAHPKILSAPDAAASVGSRMAWVETVPSLTPTREFPAPGVATRDLGPLNRATYAAARGAARMFRSELEAARATLPDRPAGAPEATDGATISLVPVSPVLLPRPADWPPTTHLTGAWTGADAGPVALDDATARFVADGPFAYVGFGSMAQGDASERGRAVVSALRGRGLRALVATGWGGVEVPADVRGADVHVVDSVPHRAVLPHAVVAVHHGGAGTVHAVARAGVPHVVVPFIADQPFWGRVLHERGLGSRPIPVRRLTADHLARAVDEAVPLRPAAQDAAAAMRDEDGLAAAIEVLERHGAA
ncbi:glycosyltransferase [Agromyces sp. SYSU T0242]|uniref:glycosyltransferase n=1 Tax=Agromyces litoreus TaxID=3158561 RepID=UPI003391239B